jgi:KUP system potassium uptake protein
MKTESTDRGYLAGMAVGALGVVYGDIGTSPLYSLRECFQGTHSIEVNPANVLGVISLILWSLLVLVSVKYLSFIMRADNKGEGGILALLSLAFPEHRAAEPAWGRYGMVVLGVFGASLLYGDGMITPAITVLGAIEGLKVATPLFDAYVIPLTVFILIALFFVQRKGTGNVGKIFGPVMVVWFISIALLGIWGVLRAPEICSAFNPLHGLRFLTSHGRAGFLVLGGVFLVLTGVEALYADMGHFGRLPIQCAWFSMVLPSLFLNYLGQGALLLREPLAIENPFFYLAPRWALYPLVGLSTMAAIIASQALISGAFSLTMQAVQMGFAPRVEIDHTSSREKGQIYIAKVNWVLMLACIGLVLGFGSSSSLAAAYGIAVSLTILITTILFYLAARRLWGWSVLAIGCLCGFFLVIELAFCGANLLKIRHGGWFPLVIALGIFTLMTTWKTGRRILRVKLEAATLPLETFLEDVAVQSLMRVKGTAVFLASNTGGTPLALLHNLKHNRVLHERNVILTIVTEEIPFIHRAQRLQIQKLPNNFYRVVGRYGFMQDPNVPRLLDTCGRNGLEFNLEETTFFLSRETILPTKSAGMAMWRRRLFAVMSRNAQHATAFFRLPANRVVELGMQVEL